MIANLANLPFTYTIFWIFIFGLLIGSFLNVVICRAFTEESIVFPSSKCPACKTPLKWFHNIPIFSYIFLRGKCAFCKEKISIQYPLIEFLTAITFVGIFLYWQYSLTTLFVFIFAALAIVISTCDIKEKVIFTIHTKILAVVGLIYNFFYSDNKLFGISESILGWALGFFVCILFSKLLKKILNTDALGDGDADILGAIGAVVGWQYVLLAPFAGAVAMCFYFVPTWLYSLITTKQFTLFITSCTFLVVAILHVIFTYFDIVNPILTLITTILATLLGITLIFQILHNIKFKQNQSLTTIPMGPVLLTGGAIIFVFKDYITEIFSALNIAKFL